MESVTDRLETAATSMSLRPAHQAVSKLWKVKVFHNNIKFWVVRWPKSDNRPSLRMHSLAA
jgi:hypothetical protein